MWKDQRQRAINEICKTKLDEKLIEFIEECPEACICAGYEDEEWYNHHEYRDFLKCVKEILLKYKSSIEAFYKFVDEKENV